MVSNIWFWQRMQSPHMTGLANALAQRGITVRFCSVEPLDDDRIGQGWEPGELVGVSSCDIGTRALVEKAIAEAPEDCLHLTQGIRRNGPLRFVQQQLARAGARQWWMMESVDERGWKAPLKRLDYRLDIRARQRSVERVLAIGAGSEEWLARVGMPEEKILPFSYFLDGSATSPCIEPPHGDRFEILFAGQLVERKAVDILIDALSGCDASRCALTIIGDGEARPQLMAQARVAAPDMEIRWQGCRGAHEVRRQMQHSDLLVLPSRFDGWGAVAGEALIEGARVIVSDACGIRNIVELDEGSAIVPSGDAAALRGAILDSIAKGRVSLGERGERRACSSAIHADRGAAFLLDLIEDPDLAMIPWLSQPARQRKAA